MNTTLEIPQEILDSARMTVADLKRELAVHLYSQDHPFIGKTHDLAEMSLWQFRQVLAVQETPALVCPDEIRSRLW